MSDPEATARVRAAVAAGAAPSRKDVEHALRECFGLSARQARRFAGEGSKALGANDDFSDIAERLAVLESVIKL